MSPRPGLAIANLLAGSWRADVQPADVPAHGLEWIASRLPATGTAGLAWERLRGTSLALHPAAATLRTLHRHNAVQRLLAEQRLPSLFTNLREAGFDPLLIKGWSLLSLYPRPGQRPVGDVDLCVPPDQFASAQCWLEQHADLARDVDLHAGVPDLADHGWESLWERSRLIALGETGIRVLCPEDQLRLLCLHFARHGGWRPLWLCDVAAAAESLPANFDWNRCLADDNLATAWVGVVLALTATLLHACVPTTTVPDWIVASVLHAWESSCPGDSHSRATRPLRTYLTRPAGLYRALSQRWPSPLEAAFKMSAHPDTRLPVWHQLRYLLQRARRWRGKPCPQRSAVFDVHAEE